MIPVKRSISLLAPALLLVLVIACGSDDPPANGDGLEIPTFETLPPSVTATPLSEVTCSVDIPAVSLRSANADQQAVVIASEWTGEDCSFFGRGFTYIPADAVHVASGELVTLILDEEAISLRAFAWKPDLSDAQIISTGQLAVSMQSSNIGRRSVTIPLSLALESEQQLPLSELDPGEYIIELTGTWSRGLATLALRLVLT